MRRTYVVGSKEPIKMPPAAPFSAGSETLVHCWNPDTVAAYVDEVVELPKYGPLFIQHDINGLVFIGFDNSYELNNVLNVAHNALTAIHLAKIVEHCRKLRFAALNYSSAQLPSAFEEWRAIHVASFLHCFHNCPHTSFQLLQLRLPGSRVASLTELSLATMLGSDSLDPGELKRTLSALRPYLQAVLITKGKKVETKKVETAVGRTRRIKLAGDIVVSTALEAEAADGPAPEADSGQADVLPYPPAASELVQSDVPNTPLVSEGNKSAHRIPEAVASDPADVDHVDLGGGGPACEPAAANNNNKTICCKIPQPSDDHSKDSSNAAIVADLHKTIQSHAKEIEFFRQKTVLLEKEKLDAEALSRSLAETNAIQMRAVEGIGHRQQDTVGILGQLSNQFNEFILSTKNREATVMASTTHTHIPSSSRQDESDQPLSGHNPNLSMSAVESRPPSPSSKAAAAVGDVVEGVHGKGAHYPNNFGNTTEAHVANSPSVAVNQINSLLGRNDSDLNISVTPKGIINTSSSIAITTVGDSNGVDNMGDEVTNKVVTRSQSQGVAPIMSPMRIGRPIAALPVGEAVDIRNTLKTAAQKEIKLWEELMLLYCNKANSVSISYTNIARYQWTRLACVWCQVGRKVMRDFETGAHGVSTDHTAALGCVIKCASKLRVHPSAKIEVEVDGNLVFDVVFILAAIMKLLNKIVDTSTDQTHLMFMLAKLREGDLTISDFSRDEFRAILTDILGVEFARWEQFESMYQFVNGGKSSISAALVVNVFRHLSPLYDLTVHQYDVLEAAELRQGKRQSESQQCQYHLEHAIGNTMTLLYFVTNAVLKSRMSTSELLSKRMLEKSESVSSFKRYISTPTMYDADESKCNVDAVWMLKVQLIADILYEFCADEFCNFELKQRSASTLLTLGSQTLTGASLASATLNLYSPFSFAGRFCEGLVQSQSLHSESRTLTDHKKVVGCIANERQLRVACLAAARSLHIYHNDVIPQKSMEEVVESPRITDTQLNGEHDDEKMVLNIHQLPMNEVIASFISILHLTVCMRFIGMQQSHGSSVVSPSPDVAIGNTSAEATCGQNKFYEMIYKHPYFQFERNDNILPAFQQLLSSTPLYAPLLGQLSGTFEASDVEWVMRWLLSMPICSAAHPSRSSGAEAALLDHWKYLDLFWSKHLKKIKSTEEVLSAPSKGKDGKVPLDSKHLDTTYLTSTGEEKAGKEWNVVRGINDLMQRQRLNQISKYLEHLNAYALKKQKILMHLVELWQSAEKIRDTMVITADNRSARSIIDKCSDMQKVILRDMRTVQTTQQQQMCDRVASIRQSEAQLENKEKSDAAVATSRALLSSPEHASIMKPVGELTSDGIKPNVVSKNTVCIRRSLDEVTRLERSLIVANQDSLQLISSVFALLSPER